MATNGGTTRMHRALDRAVQWRELVVNPADGVDLMPCTVRRHASSTRFAGRVRAGGGQAGRQNPSRRLRPCVAHWCPGRDSNPYNLAVTSPSSWRVYQFHHLGTWPADFT